MSDNHAKLAVFYGEEVGQQVWNALELKLWSEQLKAREDTLVLEEAQAWAELGSQFSLLDLRLAVRGDGRTLRMLVQVTASMLPDRVLKCAWVDDVEEMQAYESYLAEKRLVRLSTGLVPELDEEALDAVAEGILAEHCPAVLKEPRRLNAHDLAEQMGLMVRRHRIAMKQDIYGKMFFAEAQTKLFYDGSNSYQKYYIEEGTMVVDSTATYLGNVGSYDGTIVHECLHWALHRPAMALHMFKQPDEKEKAICCRVDGGVDNADKAVLLALEKQANALVPRVQMPLALFRQQTNALLLGYNRSEKWTRGRCVVMPSVIDDLAGFFGVSRQAAKLRLIEAGYEDAAGAYVYIDGRYLPPHGWTPGTLKENETFSIPLEEAARLLMEDADFAQAAQGYLYVDGHFVLDDPRYVKRDNFGEWHLTEAAQLNMECYCLKFTLTVRESDAAGYYGSKVSLLCQSEKTILTPQYDFQKFDALSPQNQEALLRREQQLMQLEAEMPEDFTLAFQKTINHFNISQAELARRTGYSEPTISNFINQETRSSLNTAIKIIFATQFPPEISLRLLKKGGYSLKAKEPSHCLWLFVLKHMFELSLEEKLKFLAKHNAPLE